MRIELLLVDVGEYQAGVMAVAVGCPEADEGAGGIVGIGAGFGRGFFAGDGKVGGEYPLDVIGRDGREHDEFVTADEIATGRNGTTLIEGVVGGGVFVAGDFVLFTTDHDGAKGFTGFSAQRVICIVGEAHGSSGLAFGLGLGKGGQAQVHDALEAGILEGFGHQATYQVVIVPAGHDDDGECAGIDAGAGHVGPPVPQGLAVGLAVGLGAVFDGVVDDDDAAIAGQTATDAGGFAGGG